MRWQVTLLAISGIALVVAVFSILLSMSAGFQMALRSTGWPDNAIIVQRGSSSELTSGIRIDDRNTILADDRIARGADGSPMASWEWVVVMSLPKMDQGGPTNVTLRPVPPQAYEVRGGIDIVGAMFQRGAGSNSVVVRMKDASQIPALDKWIRAQPQMQLQAVPETSTTPTRRGRSP
ncbi:MAG: hypothetical protein ABI565_07925 [Vicinamibacteria bacterium]